MGSIEAQGRLFLVNPEGIYFGPESRVHAHALIASTLNLKNEDFLSERYRFFLEESGAASLILEGAIGVETSVALLGPVVQNRGSISAETGHVFIGAGEKVTLDFAKDGLLKFVVEGEIEEALIENGGTISAHQERVDLTLRAARHAIESVVNTEGLESGIALIESEGKIRLVSRSEISAKEIRVDGDGEVAVSGQIEGSSVELLGDEISLIGSHIEALDGEVFVGGGPQGKGDLRRALYTTMDPDSTIVVDGTGSKEGGKVVLRGDRATVFDGKIYARGGSLGGDGGLVETSGGEVGSTTGFVDTSAPCGNYGLWLLEPPFDCDFDPRGRDGGSVLFAELCERDSENDCAYYDCSLCDERGPLRSKLLE